MKKFIMGLIVGLALSLAVTAYAEDIKSLVGKQVDGQAAVVLDGEELSVQAVIIEGTSYAPIRAVGEAVGKEVDWKEGKVVMENKQTAVVAPNPSGETTTKTFSKDVIESEIQNLEVILYDQKLRFQDRPDLTELESKITENEARLKVWKQRLAEIETK